MKHARYSYAVDGCVLTLPYAKLTVDQEPRLAADGITMESVAFVFHFVGTVTGTDLASFQQELWKYQQVLTKPRGAFTIQWSDDGESWLNYFSFEEGTDIEFGPKPGPAVFTQFSGGLSANYTWSITVVTKQCFAGCAVQPTTALGILSLSRQWSHQYDINGYCTRQVSGQLVVKSADALVNNRQADAYRAICAPELPSGYKRVSQSFTQSPDGRVLLFDVVDVEQHYQTPKPITDGEASFSIQVRGLGNMADCVLSGRFAAPANVSKQTMLQKVGDLLALKLPTDRTVIWESLSITEEIYSNVLSFSFAWRQAFASDDPKAPGTLLDKVGGPPHNEGQAGQLVGPYGGDGDKSNSGTMAPTAIKYDSCTGGTIAATPGRPGNGSPEIGFSIDRPQTETPTSGTGSRKNITQPQLDAPYTAVHEVLSFETDSHMRVFPSKVAGVDPIVQQTSNPTCTIIQAGYLVREGSLKDTPKPPTPLYDTSSSQAIVKTAFLSPQNPVPLSKAGQYSHTLHYRYVFQRIKAINSMDDLEYKIPLDPRTTETATASGEIAEKIELPSLVHIPQPVSETA